MSNCPICQTIEKKTYVLIEEADAIAFLSDEPAAPGHVIIAPKQHYPIIETVPDFLIGNIFKLAKKVSAGIFQGIGAHGTNLLVQNGLPAGQTQPHFQVHLVPRKEGDTVKLQWEPKQAPPESLNEPETKLKEEAKNIGNFQKTKPKPIEEKKTEQVEDSSEDYRIRQLRRIP